MFCWCLFALEVCEGCIPPNEGRRTLPILVTWGSLIFREMAIFFTRAVFLLFLGDSTDKGNGVKMHRRGSGDPVSGSPALCATSTLACRSLHFLCFCLPVCLVDAGLK